MKYNFIYVLKNGGLLVESFEIKLSTIFQTLFNVIINRSAYVN